MQAMTATANETYPDEAPGVRFRAKDEPLAVRFPGLASAGAGEHYKGAIPGTSAIVLHGRTQPRRVRGGKSDEEARRVGGCGRHGHHAGSMHRRDNAGAPEHDCPESGGPEPKQHRDAPEPESGR